MNTKSNAWLWWTLSILFACSAFFAGIFLSAGSPIMQASVCVGALVGSYVSAYQLANRDVRIAMGVLLGSFAAILYGWAILNSHSTTFTMSAKTPELIAKSTKGDPWLLESNDIRCTDLVGQFVRLHPKSQEDPIDIKHNTKGQPGMVDLKHPVSIELHGKLQFKRSVNTVSIETIDAGGSINISQETGNGLVWEIRFSHVPTLQDYPNSMSYRLDFSCRKISFILSGLDTNALLNLNVEEFSSERASITLGSKPDKNSFEGPMKLHCQSPSYYSMSTINPNVLTLMYSGKGHLMVNGQTVSPTVLTDLMSEDSWKTFPFVFLIIFAGAVFSKRALDVLAARLLQEPPKGN